MKSIVQRAAWLGLSLFTCGSFAATDGAEQSAGPSRWDLLGEGVTRVPGELGRIFSYPFDQPEDFSKYALGVGLLIVFDKSITTAYQNHVETPLSGFKIRDAPKPFTTLGTGGTDGWLIMGVAGTYLGGFAFGDVRAQKAGMAAGKALAYSMVVSQLLLKTVSGRKRPLASLSHDTPDGIYTDNPYDFGNHRSPAFKSDQKNSSFPSFHLTAWFAVAKVYQEAYDDYWVPYSLLTVGLASNIRGHKHWVSDMAAGALIGTLIGSSVSDGYFGPDGKLRVQATMVNRGPYVMMSYAF